LHRQGDAAVWARLAASTTGSLLAILQTVIRGALDLHLPPIWYNHVDSGLRRRPGTVIEWGRAQQSKLLRRLLIATVEYNSGATCRRRFDTKRSGAHSPRPNRHQQRMPAIAQPLLLCTHNSSPALASLAQRPCDNPGEATILAQKGLLNLTQAEAFDSAAPMVATLSHFSNERGSGKLWQESGRRLHQRARNHCLVMTGPSRTSTKRT
jgi:hypothetical protein